MIDPYKILEQVSERFSIKKSDIVSKKRDRNVSEARFFYIKLARELNKMTYKEIGSYINRKSSATIIGKDRANQLIEIYPKMESLYCELKTKILSYNE